MTISPRLKLEDASQHDVGRNVRRDDERLYRFPGGDEPANRTIGTCFSRPNGSGKTRVIEAAVKVSMAMQYAIVKIDCAEFSIARDSPS